MLLVTILLAGSVLFIVVSDPPHDLCKTQLEQFKELEKGKLFKDPKSFRKHPLVQGLHIKCKTLNSPGGCYELFSRLNVMFKHFRAVSSECTHTLTGLSVVKKTLLENFQLMTHLAWREEILSNKVSKLNWLSAADMNLFCKIKSKIITLYGKDFYLNFSQKTLLSLPGANTQNPDYVRKRSIISESCLRYS